MILVLSRNKALVIATCLLAPWVDERFVIGVPLAFLTRYIVFREKSPSSDTAAWLKGEVLVPAMIVSFSTAARFASITSFSVSDIALYFRRYGAIAYAGEDSEWYVKLLRLGFGTWNGLRCGWVFIGLGLVALIKWRRYGEAWLWSLTLFATALLGVVTASDISRSMMMLAPTVPIGWSLFRNLSVPSARLVTFGLATAALVLPAHQIVTDMVVPVRSIWHEARELAEPPAASAYFSLGLAYAEGAGVQKDLGRAVQWFRRGAELGYAPAQVRLGLALAHGIGTNTDQPQSAVWFTKAAEQNDAGAQFNLSVMYSTGQGVPKDESEAVKWLQRSSELGHAPAQLNLGIRYYSGRGVPMDKARALSLFERAAAQNDVQAMYNLGVVYWTGQFVAQDTRKAVDYFQRSAEFGYPPSQYMLGAAYLTGEGLEKNPVRALVWLTFAAGGGDTQARGLIPKANAGLSETELQEATRLYDEIAHRLGRSTTSRRRTG